MASGSLLPTSLALTNTLTSKLSYHVLLFNANFMYKSLFNGRALFARKLKGPSCFGQNRQVIQLSCAKDGPIWDFELFVRGKSDGWIIWQKGIRRRGVIGCTIRNQSGNALHSGSKAVEDHVSYMWGLSLFHVHLLSPFLAHVYLSKHFILFLSNKSALSKFSGKGSALCIIGGTISHHDYDSVNVDQIGNIFNILGKYVS